MSIWITCDGTRMHLTLLQFDHCEDSIASSPGFPLVLRREISRRKAWKSWHVRGSRGRRHLIERGREADPLERLSCYVAFSLGLWISSEDGTRGSAQVLDNASSEPVFVYIRRDKAEIRLFQT